MSPAIHSTVSTVLSIVVWKYTASWPAVISCLLGGILIDIDHAIEYVIHFGVKDFSLKNIFRACAETSNGRGTLQFKKLYLFFHSYELVFILLISVFFVRNPVFLAFVTAYTVHLLLDGTGNNLSIPFYFFFVRARWGFLVEKGFRFSLIQRKKMRYNINGRLEENKDKQKEGG